MEFTQIGNLVQSVQRWLLVTALKVAVIFSLGLLTGWLIFR
jgi:hypothetical protein